MCFGCLFVAFFELVAVYIWFNLCFASIVSVCLGVCLTIACAGIDLTVFDCVLI